MPEVGGYADMAACVAANGDKEDPKAYCMALMHEAEKLAKADRAKRFEIKKADDVMQMVFGWASVSKVDGENNLVDLQDDEIDGPVLEKAAYEYVYESGVARDMHQGEPVGRLVEAVAITDEKLKAMGLTRAGAPAMGFWVGYKIPDKATYERVKNSRQMFSIGGKCLRAE